MVRAIGLSERELKKRYAGDTGPVVALAVPKHAIQLAVLVGTDSQTVVAIGLERTGLVGLTRRWSRYQASMSCFGESVRHGAVDSPGIRAVRSGFYGAFASRARSILRDLVVLSDRDRGACTGRPAAQRRRSTCDRLCLRTWPRRDVPDAPQSGRSIGAVCDAGREHCRHSRPDHSGPNRRTHY